MARQGRPRAASNGYGQFSKYRVSWSKTAGVEFVVMMYPGWEEEDHDPHDNEYLRNEPGYAVRLVLMNRGRNIGVSLTSLTLIELEALEEVVQLAIGLARPVVELRDKAANEEYEQGNDSFARLYRQLPEIAVRAGNVLKYGAGILDRSADALERLARVERRANRLRRGGDRLAEPLPDEDVTEDEPPTAD